MSVTTETTKQSFAQLIAQREAAKHNSDLANLAEAAMSIKTARQELDALEARVNKLAGEIEAGTIHDMTAVREVYQAVQKATNFRL